MRGKREALINAALELFMEKGYEGTIIRSITRRAGCEVGLFYYYFKSKDEIFDLAIGRFIEGYRPGFENALRKGQENPKELLTYFFAYLSELTEQFQLDYGEKVHWTVQQAIRSQILELIKSYLEEALQIMIDSGMPKPSVALPVLANMMAYGVGSVIIHMNAKTFAEDLPEMRKAVHLLLGSPHNAPEDIFF